MGSVKRPVPSLGLAYCDPKGFSASVLASVLAMKEEKEGPETGSCARQGKRDRDAGELGCVWSLLTQEFTSSK